MYVPLPTHLATISQCWLLRYDQGRFKVRDPRLFDPCSMRRRPDTGVPSTSATHHKGSLSSSSTGVTLLLGRRADDFKQEDNHEREEQPFDRAEQASDFCVRRRVEERTHGHL